MTEKTRPNGDIAECINALTSGAIPEFIYARTVDKTLSVAITELNNLVLFGQGEERETAVEALTRLGFIHPIANDPG